MSPFVAAFGRFTLKQLVAAVLPLYDARSTPKSLSSNTTCQEQKSPAENDPCLAKPDPLAGAWGIAWCHGNRLESLRQNRPPTSDPEFKQLDELRSDLALLHLHPPLCRLGLREVQPFIRREHGLTWAFIHHGAIERPELLETGTRLPDGPSPSERYFLHLLNALDMNDPAKSLSAAMQRLDKEPALSFILTSSQMTVIGCGRVRTGDDVGRLYLGRGALLRLVAPAPLSGFENVRWETLPEGAVVTVMRERRSLPDAK